jgi:hypothetical protein
MLFSAAILAALGTLPALAVWTARPPLQDDGPDGVNAAAHGRAVSP